VAPVSACDVLVIGGGPAGSAAAHLLASWGRSVVVIHRGDAPSQSLAESLPPSTRKLLRFLGLLDRVEATTPYPNSGNIVDWAGAARTISSADAGFHVSRAQFDTALRAGARAAGAEVVGGVVRRIDEADSIRATYSTQQGSHVIDAQAVLDCSGRAGIVARRGLRRVESRARTLAIVAEWECEQWPAGERTLTTVESYADGWAWSVPLSATRRQCTVMIDARPGRGALTAIYERELAKATALTARLAGARRVSAPWSCDSSLYDASRAADGRMLLVGDAASFIEPLSSAGVKKALVSAWRAAVVVNTCLADARMASAAIELHVEREKEVFAECQRRSAVFFRDAAATYGTAFWAARAEACGSAEAPASEPGIQEAFERLRGAASVRLRPSERVRFAPAPVIDGRQVVMRDAVIVAGSDAPLQFAAGVDLTSLVRIAASYGEVPTIIDAYQRRVGPVPAAGLLTGLSLLVARDALVAEDAQL